MTNLNFEIGSVENSSRATKKELHGRMRLFRGMIRRRGLSIKKLADAIHSERTHVGQVLRGAPGRGGQTRGKLVKLLTDEELSVLGWQREVARVSCSTGNIHDDREEEVHLCPI